MSLDPLLSDYGLQDPQSSYPDFAQSLADAGSSSFTPDSTIPMDQSTVDPGAAQQQVDSLGTPNFSSSTQGQPTDFSGAMSGYAFGGMGDLLSALNSFDVTGGTSSFLSNDPTATDPNAVDPNAPTDTTTPTTDPNAPLANDMPTADMFGGSFQNPNLPPAAAPKIDSSFMPPAGFLQ